MAGTDRAFRALSRSEPDVVLELLRAALPDFPLTEHVSAEDVEDPKLDIPPPLEADLIVRVGDAAVLHVEGQGYHEADFPTRVHRYRLAIALRKENRPVHTIALWFRRPPRSQRDLEEIEIDGITVRLKSVVLEDVPASLILKHPNAVCFLPGANPEGRSDDELCRIAAAILAKDPENWQRLLLCTTVAVAAGRYDAMMRAMQEEKLKIPAIEDLIRFGAEKGRLEGIETGRLEGIETGRREGLLEMAREGLLDLLSVRGLTVTEEHRRRIASETDLERLRRWHRNAATAGDVDSALKD